MKRFVRFQVVKEESNRLKTPIYKFLRRIRQNINSNFFRFVKYQIRQISKIRFQTLRRKSKYISLILQWYSMRVGFRGCSFKGTGFQVELYYQFLANSFLMSSPKEKFEYIIKLVILGDTAVGKTNLLLRFTDASYKPTHLPTIGVDFKVKIMDVNGRRVKCQLWDTAGQERFRTITETYYKGASGIVLVYSVRDRKSFSNISNWMSQIAQRQEDDIPKIIVGNKCDLRSRERCVSYNEGKELADKYNSTFIEASAKEGINVDTIFDTLGRQIMERLQKDDSIKETTMGVTGTKLNCEPQVLKAKLNCCEGS